MAVLTSSNLEVNRCKRCLRYQQNGSSDAKHYRAMEPESPALMALCLKQMPAFTNHGALSATTGLQSVTLVDSNFVWQEPNNKRIKLKLTVRATLLVAPVTVQQRCVVTFVEKNRQCDDCNKEFQNQQWNAIVQLREKRQDDSNKNLARMETALAKSKDLRRRVISLEISKNGFDFYFSTMRDGAAFSSFCARISPTRVRQTRKLVSSDNHSNTANVKTTFVCDIVPLEKDDLVLCDKNGSSAAGFLRGRIALVSRVSSNVRLVSAAPSRDQHDKIPNLLCELSQDNYWKGEKAFQILLSSNSLTNFVVMDVEPCDPSRSGGCDAGGELAPGDTDAAWGSKFALADVMLARESDYGVNDEVVMCVTHLGNILQVGDLVEGYDLTATVLPDTSSSSFVSSFEMPDVVLVRKTKSGGADAGTEVEAGSGMTADDSKKTRRQKKKDAMKGVKENKGRGYRGVKKQNQFEGHLSSMGFMKDAADRAALAAEDDEELDEELEEEIMRAEQALAAEDDAAADDDDGDDDDGDGGGGERGGVEAEDVTLA
jgi:nonsense-mediated mRNA decay protein 3